MCEPISASTLAIIAGVTGLASAGVSAYGQYKQGKAEQQTYNMQADISRQNAAIAQENAGLERSAGLEEQRRQRLKTSQLIGQQKAAMAANNINITSGTPLDVIQDTAEIGELDAIMIGFESERRARNYESQASNFLQQADIYNLSGKNAYKSGLYSAGSSLLGGVGKVAGQWSNYGTANAASGRV